MHSNRIATKIFYLRFINVCNHTYYSLSHLCKSNYAVVLGILMALLVTYVCSTRMRALVPYVQKHLKNWYLKSV